MKAAVVIFIILCFSCVCGFILSVIKEDCSDNAEEKDDNDVQI